MLSEVWDLWPIERKTQVVTYYVVLVNFKLLIITSFPG